MRFKTRKPIIEVELGALIFDKNSENKILAKAFINVMGLLN